jgi:chromosome segregation ATPase
MSDDLRSINNRISELSVQLANIVSDLKKVTREEEAHLAVVRKLAKKIKRGKIELDELKKKTKTFAKKKFALLEEKRFAKKQLEETLTQRRILETSGSSSNDTYDNISSDF